MERTCYNCIHHNICILFNHVWNDLKTIRINIDGDAAPNKMNDIFKSIAGCCLEYKDISKITIKLN